MTDRENWCNPIWNNTLMTHTERERENIDQPIWNNTLMTQREREEAQYTLNGDKRTTGSQ